jgi:Leucine rich repeat variant
MRGVAANPAAPSSALLRLLTPPGRPAWKVLCTERALPDDVVAAVLAHPERVVRASFARNRYADPAQRGRLVNDPDALVRAALAGGPRPRLGPPRPLPDDVLEQLLTGHDEPGRSRVVAADEIKQELESSGQIPQSFRRSMPGHQNPALRVQATGLWLWLTPAQREALLADPVPAVRQAAAQHNRTTDPEAMAADLPEKDCHHRSMLLVNYAVSHTVGEQCLATGRDLWALAGNPHTPADIVTRLAQDLDPDVRARVASRCDLESEMLERLARDPDDQVRTRALVHPSPRTEEQRRLIDSVIGRTADDIGQVHEWFRPPEHDWLCASAVSGHPLLRRVAAMSPNLPADLVNRLAGDPDAHVRHLLAYNHPLAPPHLLLEAFIAGSRQRPFLRTHPRLPRTGLTGLLDHQDPEVRALAAADPTLPQPPLSQLKDPDARVQAAAAANPLQPTDVLTELLPDPHLSQAAASNPALSAAHLHDLLDRAGIPKSEPTHK